ncbi:hypothetical protein [Moorena producens]
MSYKRIFPTPYSLLPTPYSILHTIQRHSIPQSFNILFLTKYPLSKV